MTDIRQRSRRLASLARAASGLYAALLLAGFSAPGGASTKMKMLEIEGARRGSAPELFDHLPWALKPRR